MSSRPESIAIVYCGVVMALLFGASVSLRAGDGEAPPDDGLASLLEVVLIIDDPRAQYDLLDGLRTGLEGRGPPAPPPIWTEVERKLGKSPDARVRESVTLIAVLFGDPKAARALRDVVANTAIALPKRERALDALSKSGASGVPDLLLDLLDESAVRRAALRALARYDDARTSKAILSRYESLDATERALAIETLASRLEYARALVDAVESGRVRVRDVSRATVRQLRAFHDSGIDRVLEKLWGAADSTPGERKEEIERLRTLLAPERLARSDASRGRGVFDSTCGRCHRLFGEGGEVGPELTGADRGNLFYLLENIVDPNATVAEDFRAVTVVTRRGRVLSGILVEDAGDRLAIRTIEERVVLPKRDVVTVEKSDLSMMPEGLLDRLDPEDVCDLVAYLQSANQVPRPPAASEPAGSDAGRYPGE